MNCSVEHFASINDDIVQVCVPAKNSHIRGVSMSYKSISVKELYLKLTDSVIRLMLDVSSDG